MYLFNPSIKTIKPYVAGKPIEELGRELGLKESAIIKLASNENPLGPSPKAVAAINKQLDKLNRYPDSNYFLLRSKLSEKLKLDIEQIVLGNGSDELIDCIIKTFSSPNDEILSSESTFLEYEIITKVNNRLFKTAKLKDFRYSLQTIAQAVTDKTKIIFIANPNNPTGTYVNVKEVLSFLNQIPKNIIVVFDEAYNEFIDCADFPNSLSYLKDYNIIALRTFSKIFGLAGLRIGFAVTRQEFAKEMNKVRQPFNVNSLASAAAYAALDDLGFVKRSQKLIWEEKKFLYENLKKLEIKFVPSVANFILIDVKTNSQSFFTTMLKKGIIVRPMDAYGLDNFIRLTIGTHNENVRFINELRKLN
jgi:histidinol-phosphate aminotransferase